MKDSKIQIAGNGRRALAGSHAKIGLPRRCPMPAPWPDFPHEP